MDKTLISIFLYYFLQNIQYEKNKTTNNKRNDHSKRFRTNFMKYITIYEKPVYKEINSKEKEELGELRKERKELIELKRELSMIKNRIDTIEK